MEVVLLSAFTLNFFFLNKKDVLPWNKNKTRQGLHKLKAREESFGKKNGKPIYIYMTRIFEPLRSFHHLESLPLPSATEYKQLLSEHCSVIQQPQQRWNCRRKPSVSSGTGIKPQKWKAALLHLSLMNYAMLPKQTNYNFLRGKSGLTLHAVISKSLSGQWHPLAY